MSVDVIQAIGQYVVFPVCAAVVVCVYFYLVLRK